MGRPEQGGPLCVSFQEMSGLTGRVSIQATGLQLEQGAEGAG